VAKARYVTHYVCSNFLFPRPVLYVLVCTEHHFYLVSDSSLARYRHKLPCSYLYLKLHCSSELLHATVTGLSSVFLPPYRCSVAFYERSSRALAAGGPAATSCLLCLQGRESRLCMLTSSQLPFNSHCNTHHGFANKVVRNRGTRDEMPLITSARGSSSAKRAVNRGASSASKTCNPCKSPSKSKAHVLFCAVLC